MYQGWYRSTEFEVLDYKKILDTMYDQIVFFSFCNYGYREEIKIKKIKENYVFSYNDGGILCDKPSNYSSYKLIPKDKINEEDCESFYYYFNSHYNDHRLSSDKRKFTCSKIERNEILRRVINIDDFHITFSEDKSSGYFADWQGDGSSGIDFLPESYIYSIIPYINSSKPIAFIEVEPPSSDTDWSVFRGFIIENGSAVNTQELNFDDLIKNSHDSAYNYIPDVKSVLEYYLKTGELNINKEKIQEHI